MGHAGWLTALLNLLGMGGGSSAASAGVGSFGLTLTPVASFTLTLED